MSRVNFTTERVNNFSCPSGSNQALIWDSNTLGLGLRTTPRGRPTYVFQGRYQGKTIRITIGRPDSWSIPEAREKARELQRQIDEGYDPRQIKSENTKAAVKAKLKVASESVTIGVLWSEYLKGKKGDWANTTYSDHLKAAQAGGEPYKRWKGKMTKAGPLASLMLLKVSELDSSVIEKLARKESKIRPTNLRLALRMLRAFLTWCNEVKKLPLTAAIASTKEIKRIAGKPQVKRDNLLKEQLSAWFEHVRAIPNPVISAFLQCLILTGARRNELLQLKWRDINYKWRGMTLHDKVEDDRQIPLTPYVEHLIKGLPRRNKWVFSSPTSKSGQLIEPSKQHSAACKAAGVEVTIHGLRRSFKSLSEWQELPVGVVAQIMGHKPSATAERHYTVRPIDLLRIHHEKLEEWIIEQAGLVMPPKRNSLQLVDSAGNV